MTQAANTYGQALYDLAKEENLGKTILEELSVLKGVFAENPQYSKLLSAPDIPKQERCGILDEAFRGKVNPYVLNFMKILTEKGYIRFFPDCCDAYRGFYNEDNGILVVKAVSAVALSDAQKQKLAAKLEANTGKQIDLQCSVDAAQLGGLRLSYSGKQVDGTVKNRMDAIAKLLKNTVL
jgi:F-type H+-transporting ATPase subunit delta